MAGGPAGAPSDSLDEEDSSGQDAAGQGSTDGKTAEQQQAVLLALKKGQPVKLLSVTPKQHRTQPPPRYTEASLVKALEELGVGRPSTYASILKVLQVTWRLLTLACGFARPKQHADVRGVTGACLGTVQWKLRQSKNIQAPFRADCKMSRPSLTMGTVRQASTWPDVTM